MWHRVLWRFEWMVSGEVCFTRFRGFLIGRCAWKDKCVIGVLWFWILCGGLSSHFDIGDGLALLTDHRIT
jgi:hypothetical protein